MKPKEFDPAVAENEQIEHKKKKNKRGKLSTKQKIAIIAVLALYALILASVSVYVFYRPNVDTTSQKYVETVLDSEGNVIERKEVVQERLEGTYNILVLGHDRAAMLTDVFMLVNINNNDNSITVMQIPRDTWISNTDGMYIPTNKINAVFSTYFYQYLNSGEEQHKAYNHALTSLADLLEKNLGIRLDYSAIMDLDGFSNIVDILGGVEMNIPFHMYYNDPAQGLYIDIPAGPQTLNGSQAEGFVRYRAGYATADLGRQNAQKEFIAALFAKVKSSISITNVDMLGDLTNEIFNNIDTDMTTANLLFFAKCALQCDLSTINMMTMPGNLAGNYFVMNRAAVKDVMNTCYNVFDKEITDSLFDPSRIFSSYDGGISYVYELPADQVYDNTVYNGQEIENSQINIPLN